MSEREWPLHYILIDRTPYAVDMETWAKWMENASNRQVAVTLVGECRISTVFLGLDHSWGKGAPVLFETMVLGGPLNEEMRRYRTYVDAKRGHDDTVAKVRKAAAQIKAIADAAGAKPQ